MADPFETHEKGLNSPITKAFSITPNDSADLDNATRGLYVGTSGDVAVIHKDDTSSVTYANLQGGVWHPISVSRVLSTGTDATGILGGY